MVNVSSESYSLRAPTPMCDEIYNRPVVALRQLARRLHGQPDFTLVWPFGACPFSARFRCALSFLDGLGLTPGPLRAGGATALLEQACRCHPSGFLG